MSIFRQKAAKGYEVRTPLGVAARQADLSPSLHRLRVVPRIASFDGLVLKMFFNDHPPPHVHIYAGRIGRPGVQAARISIEMGEVIAGQLAASKVPLVRRWCERHRTSLYVDWDRAQRGLHPTGRYDQ